MPIRPENLGGDSERAHQAFPRWCEHLRSWGVDPGLGWPSLFLAVLLAPASSQPRDWSKQLAALFPQIELNRLRPLDPIRFLVQLTWLALVRIRVTEPDGGPLGEHRRAWTRARERLSAGPAGRAWARARHGLAIARSALRATVWRLEPGGDAIASRVLHASWWVRHAIYIVGTALAFVLITTPFDPQEHAVLSGMLLLIALAARSIAGRSIALLLIVLSVIASARYLWWRVAFTLNWASDLDLVLGVLLFLAECYAVFMLFVGYFQTARPLQRDPVPLPKDLRAWPSIDIYIPTYNEPLEVIMPTVIAALAMDWPRDKLKVFVLDDGKSEVLREFASEVGANYVTRADNAHAKAGNLNHGLAHTSGEFVAVFDCDHVPTRSFLRMAMGWFLRDARLALVQTPHHFFSPDPFERNLGVFRRMPNESELFHGLIQDGNDLWNATFFCGSCAVLKRAALDEIGGFAVETVTEDAHTALKLQRRGYTTALVNIPLAAGLATESLSAHIVQRIRWARGMAQIFRLDNPFLGGGLTWAQRICYGSAMLHFFNGGPRLIFLTAPAGFLLAHAYVIHAAPIEILLFFLPHMAHAIIANSSLQGRHRRSFWSEIYETVLAWYIAWPTVSALLDPRRGKFNVTLKGGLTSLGHFDWRIAAPFLALAALNLSAFAAGVGRIAWGPADEQGTALINMAWCVYNLVLLGAAIAVASEPRQRRVVHRAPLALDASLRSPDGQLIGCQTKDISLGGIAISLAEAPDLAIGDAVFVSLARGQDRVDFPARVIALAQAQLSLSWQPLTHDQMVALVECTFSRPDAWSTWQQDRRPDRVLEGMREVLATGFDGYRRLAKHALAHATARTHLLANVVDRAWLFAASLAPRTPTPFRPS